MSYQLKQPKTWKQFKAMPTELQQEYLAYLQKAFNVSKNRLADMFGVSPTTVTNYCEKENLTMYSHLNRRMTGDELRAWNKFCKGESQCVPSNATSTTTTSPPITVGANTASSQGSQDMKLHNFKLRYSGAIDAVEIAERLEVLIGNSVGDLVITYKQVHAARC
jgi:hypothetical protein